MSTRRWVIIGVPGNRRVTAFAAALIASGEAAPLIVPWLDVIDDPRRLVGICAEGDLVRIESPGEHFDTWRALAEIGARDADQRAHIAGLAVDIGRIRLGSAWFSGLRAVVGEIMRALESCGATALNRGDDILSMCDKRVCQQRLQQAGIPVPPMLEPVQDHGELRHALRARGWMQAFIKPRWGSSGAGVIAYRHRDEREMAISGIELARDAGSVALYSTKRIRRCGDARDIATMVNAILADGAVVQQWLPKAGFDGGTVDVRVLTIAGRPQHTVLRTSASPITNLHLGNRRGDIDAFFAAMGQDRKRDILSTASRVASVFAGCLYTGIDVMLTPHFAHHAVIEVNAWGDLLPRLEHAGLSTYAAEIAAVLYASAQPSTVAERG